MSTQAAPQLLASIDLDGLSVVTSTMTGLLPRQGVIYNPATLAAAVPIWFHPLNDGRYMALLRQYWTDATVGTTGPQAYSAHEVVTVPATVIVDPTTGNSGSVEPLRGLLEGTREAWGAASRFDNLYTVGTIDDAAHLSWHRLVGDALMLGGEEIIPVTNGVSFHLGCYVSGDFLYVFGADMTDQVYLSRKRWGRIGTNTDRTATYTWEYLGDKGWLADPTVLAPLKDSGNSPITSVGPVSCAHHRDRSLMVVVVSDADGVRTPQGYVSRDVEPRWRSVPFLGSVLGDDTTYLGGTLYLQSQLHPTLSTVPSGAFTAFPAVSSIVSNLGGDSSILTSWLAWPLFR